MEHTVHVDAMLASMEPHEFDEWMAEHNIEPWGDDWRQAGIVAAEIHNGFSAIVAAFTDGDMEAVTATDFYRPAKRKDKQLRYLTPQESLRKNRMTCGV